MAGAVATVPIRSRRRDPDSRLSVGLRVSHLLNTVDLQPPGFSPSATLIIRRFRDPMPRQLQPDAWAVHSTTAWERAAQSGLTELSRRAARPASGFVPLNSNAVLFTDQSELLACLARDLLSGSARSLWWWRAVLRALPSTAVDAIVSAWRRDARYVPAALAQLVSRGEALSVISAFTPAQALDIFQEVASSFEIGNLCSLFHQPLQISFRPRDSGKTLGDIRSVGTIHEVQESTSNPTLPPWDKFFSDSIIPPALGPERSTLLGVGLCLQEIPRIVRGRHFAQAFAHWRQSTLQPSRTTENASHLRPIEQRADSFITEDRLKISDPARPPGAQEARVIEIEVKNASDGSVVLLGSGSSHHPPALPTHEVAAPTSDIVQQDAPETAPARDAASSTIKLPSTPPPPIPGDAGSTTLPRIHPLSVSFSTEPKIIAPDAIPAESPSPPKDNAYIGESFQTELGGILFLINVLKALDLPRSIETECRRDLGISSWELLELLGRCLLAPSESHLTSDPVWEAIALLDGRSTATPPGTHFAPSNFYRIPEPWISSASAPISLEKLQIRQRGSLLELWHPNGFPILSRRFAKQASLDTVRKEAKYFTDGSAELSPFQNSPRPHAGCHPVGIRIGKPLRRFLAFLLPYVRVRLAQSLGLPLDRRPFFAKSLLLQRAKIWITKTHVDLMMDLNNASGRIRLSGLDATPGWVPSFGHVITFHFGKGN
jgi:hypothetical protein